MSSELVQDCAAVVPARCGGRRHCCCRCCAGSRRARRAGGPLRFLVIHHPLGTPASIPWRPGRHRHDQTASHCRSTARRSRRCTSKMAMIDGLNIVTAIAGHRRQQRRPEHPRGRPGRAHDRPADAGADRPAGPRRGRRSIDQIFLDKSPLLGGEYAASRPVPYRCSWPPISAPTATRSRRACCRIGDPLTRP